MTNTDYFCLTLDFDTGEAGRGGTVSLGIPLRNIAATEMHSIANGQQESDEHQRWRKELVKFANGREIETLGIHDRLPM